MAGEIPRITGGEIIRLAPSANYGAPVPRFNQAQIIRIDQRDGGAYRLSGTVTVSGTPASRRVKLFSQAESFLIREAWSDAVTGMYAFENIRPGTYFVIAFDYTGAFDPEAKADLQSEPMP